MLARDQPYDPAMPEGQAVAETLSVIEPVVWGRGALHDQPLVLTSDGRANPWLADLGEGRDAGEIFASLPGFTFMTPVEKEKAASIVLARVTVGGASGGDASGRPAIVSMAYGRGSVVAILGEGLWQWRMLPSPQEAQPEIYDHFWSNLVRWMALGGDFQPGQQFALRLSRTSEQLGRPLTFDVLYKEQADSPAAIPHPRLTIIDPDGRRHELALRRVTGNDLRFTASYEPPRTGIYRALIDSPNDSTERHKAQPQEQGFSIYQNDVERLDTSAQSMPLRVLTEASGGALFDALDAQGFLHHLQRARAAVMSPPQREYIWDSGSIMTALLTWLGIEWIIRRKAGLL